MSRMYPYFFLVFFIQIIGIILLIWGVQVLMPVIVESLLEGMIQWNTAGVLYCWIIQMLLLGITFSLRDYWVERTKYWTTNAPLFMKCILVLGVVLVLFNGIQLLISKVAGISFLVIVELSMLLIQIYCLVGIAVPMGILRSYKKLKLT